MNSHLHDGQLESWQRILLHLKCLALRPQNRDFYIRGIKREISHERSD